MRKIGKSRYILVLYVLGLLLIFKKKSVKYMGKSAIQNLVRSIPLRLLCALCLI